MEETMTKDIKEMLPKLTGKFNMLKIKLSMWCCRKWYKQVTEFSEK